MIVARLADGCANERSPNGPAQSTNSANLSQRVRPRVVYLILHISPHHSPRLRCHHLSLPRPFALVLKLISFTNPFLYSLFGSIWSGCTDLGLADRIFLIANHQPLFHICITLPVESAPFIPSTLFCSLSCSPHPAHITSSQSPSSLPSPITASTFHSRLKTHLFHKSFPP